MIPRKIEIPFGASDSELCGCEYTIPEGMEAEIKDGKVIVRKKESDDERIRKELLNHCYRCSKQRTTVVNIEDYNRWIAWLEKQKEQKPQYSSLCNTTKDKIREYIANHFIADTVVKTDMESIVKAMEEGVRLGKEEQKPAEWSEEDKDYYDAIIAKLEITQEDASLTDNQMDFLKSLRPSWKPSEEQMEAFECAERWYTDNMGHNPALYQLLFDLKKL